MTFRFIKNKFYYKKIFNLFPVKDNKCLLIGSFFKKKIIIMMLLLIVIRKFNKIIIMVSKKYKLFKIIKTNQVLTILVQKF
jgi:hypothetical protein